MKIAVRMAGISRQKFENRHFLQEIELVSLLLGGRNGFICHYQQAFNPQYRFQARSQKCEKRLLASSCLSVRPNGTLLLPLDGFS